MIIDDSILLFRSALGELETPQANDVLYLNACMWIYDKDRWNDCLHYRRQKRNNFFINT